MICKIKKCRGRKIRARGLCARCYVKAWRDGKFIKSNPDCKVDSCKGNHYGNGYCLAHYWQHRRNGLVTREVLGTTTDTCTVQECQDSHRARGLCTKHYYKSFSLVKRGCKWQEAIDIIKGSDEVGPPENGEIVQCGDKPRIELLRERWAKLKRKQEREIEYQLRGTAGDFDPWGDKGPDTVFDEQIYMEG